MRKAETPIMLCSDTSMCQPTAATNGTAGNQHKLLLPLLQLNTTTQMQ
jgi:hypothetical protein